MRNNFDGFQNIDNNPNMNRANTMFMSSNFRNGPNINQDNSNFNLMNSNQNMGMTMTQSHVFKRKLRVQLTGEENMFYNKLFSTLDNNNQGIIMGKPAANFMKTSGLDKNILKKIWLIAAQNSNTQMDKEEFFVAMRLIALAQNNMPFSAENIERNNPIPPLPQFNINMNNNMNQNNNQNQNNFGNRNNQDNFNNTPNSTFNNQNNQNFNNNNQNSIFDISESEKINYKNIFDNQKEPNLERIKAHNAIIVWKDNNASDDAIRTVANIIKPLENKGFMNLKEFQVACHLINISKNIQLPQKLPLSLVNFLGRNNNININNNNNFQNMRFNTTNNINNNLTNNPMEYSRTNSNSTFSQYLKTNPDNNESNFNLNTRPVSNVPFIDKNDNNINQGQNNGRLQDIFKREEELTKKNDILKNQINVAKNKVEDLLKEITSIQNKQNAINNELNNLRQEINIIKNNGNLNSLDKIGNININNNKKNNNIDLNNNLIKKNIDDIAKNMRYDSSDLNENINQSNSNLNFNTNDNQNLENQNKKQNLMDLMDKMDLQNMNANINQNNNNVNQNNNNNTNKNENKADSFDLDFDDDFKSGTKDVNPYELGNENKKEEGNSAQKNNEDDFNF